VIETPDFKLTAFDDDSFPGVPDESIFENTGMMEQSRRNLAKLKQSDDRTIIRADLEDIQARRTVWSTCCYLGTEAESIMLNCRVYADNLKQPFEQTVLVQPEVE
jgi:hypothetical protein